MTKLLETALEAVRTLSPAEQDEIARTMLMLAKQADEDEGEEIDPADFDAVMQGLDDMKNGRFATDQEMEALFRKFDT
jgi:predicted transcriptional regulator